jgi:hypothetical protein
MCGINFTDTFIIAKNTPASSMAFTLEILNLFMVMAVLGESYAKVQLYKS